MASSWSKPLKMDCTINKALVAQTLAEYVPEGQHDHDDRERGYGAKSASGNRARRTIGGVSKGGWPRESGRLRKFTGHIPNWHLKNKGQSCYIVYFLPYVRIINWGGNVPGVSFDKWKMHWSDGEPVYRKSRRGYSITGQHFLEKGLIAFAQRAGNLNITWAKGTDTA